MGVTADRLQQGNAQRALNRGRMAHLTGDETLLHRAKKANQLNMSVQYLQNVDPGVGDGIPTSFSFRWRIHDLALSELSCKILHRCIGDRTRRQGDKLRRSLSALLN